MKLYNKSDKISRYGLCEYDYVSHKVEASNYYGCVTSIDSGRIIKVDYKNIYSSVASKSKIENIKDYCLDRFIRKNITTDSFLFTIHGGYYGDEAGSEWNVKAQKELDLFVDKLNSSSNETELIELVLIDEYGFILDELKNKKWTFDKVLLSNIIPAAGMRHINKSIIDTYVNEKSCGIYNLSCLCQKNGDKYRLIDGYHRYSAAKKLNKTKIITIYCE